MSSRSSQPRPLQREPSPLEREALDWLARRDRGLSEAERERLQAWLVADPRHGQVLAEFDGTWAMMDRLGEIPVPGGQDPAAVTAGDPPRARGGWNRRAVPWSLAAAFVLLAGVVFWRSTPQAGGRLAPAAGEHFATEVGALRKLSLPDGSVLQLNTDSAVAVLFSSQERRVRLDRGEAHFSVAREPGRPFVVSAAGMDVRAVGTAFNVRVRPETVEVLVTAGRVRVDAAGAEAPVAAGARRPGDELGPPPAVGAAGMRAAAAELPELIAGQRMVVTLPTPSQAAPSVEIAPLGNVEIGRTLAWQERRLEFEAAPLAEIVAEFNRYHRQKLVLADAALGRQRFGGTFRADDPAAFLRLLESHFGVVAERGENGTILRLAVP